MSGAADGIGVKRQVAAVKSGAVLLCVVGRGAAEVLATGPNWL
jgi:hypothetical protein